MVSESALHKFVTYSYLDTYPLKALGPTRGWGRQTLSHPLQHSWYLLSYIFHGHSTSVVEEQTFECLVVQPTVSLCQLLKG